MNIAINKAGMLSVITESKYAKRTLMLALVLLIVAAVQIVIVSICIHFAKQQAVTYDEPNNGWLDAAEFLTVSNPDVFSARASFLRQKSLLSEFKSEKQLLTEALANLESASRLRPFWPYYSLAELNILTLLKSDALVVQSKIDFIIELAPNERGLDKHFLELAFHNWEKLTKEQKRWMLKRLTIAPRRTFNYIYSVAKKLKKNTVICTNLPYAKIKRLCKAR